MTATGLTPERSRPGVTRAEGAMDLFIDPASDRGLSAQLYQQIREGIAAGRLRPGDQLLPSRHVAQQLGLSRHTVTTAYGRLAAEGFTQGRAGGGSVVAGLRHPRRGRPSGLRPSRPATVSPAGLPSPDCSPRPIAGSTCGRAYPTPGFSRPMRGAGGLMGRARPWPDRRRPVTRPGRSSYGGPSPAGLAGPGRLPRTRAR